MNHNSIHASALVRTDRIGPFAEVRAFTYIESDTCVGRFAHIGSHCTIQGAQVGEQVTLGQGVHLPAGVTVEQGATLGDHVAIDQPPGPRREPPATRIGEGAHIGPNATIRAGLSIGRHARVEPGSVVRESVPDYAHVAGPDGHQLGWVCPCGQPLALPVQGDGHTVCTCGQAYVLAGGRLAGGS